MKAVAEPPSQWDFICDACGAEGVWTVVVGDTSDATRGAAWLCLACLEDAARVLREAMEEGEC